ncbi:MAG: hypothetical protein ACYCUG_17545 [Acidimicrobiales bacterium]
MALTNQDTVAIAQRDADSGRSAVARADQNHAVVVDQIVADPADLSVHHQGVHESHDDVRSDGAEVGRQPR